MMKLKVKEVAERLGIKNASQLRSRTNLGVSTCYQLWEGTAQGIQLDTLNTLCNVLQVGPAMLFEYTPDVEVQSGGAAPAEAEAKPRQGSEKRSGRREGRKALGAAAALV